MEQINVEKKATEECHLLKIDEKDRTKSCQMLATDWKIYLNRKKFCSFTWYGL